uniref:Uncharacterized protein n=1 Tax=Amphora coffeiformis TaxID=265554 RepID=A0A7S3L392_9STRA|eukprot:scaffold12636_cov176-Amphora_coffeaeformis.AAC.2
MRGRSGRSDSFSVGDDSHHEKQKVGEGDDHDKLPEPILMYHESARSIVFRDHLRRKAKKEEEAASLERQLSSASKEGTVPKVGVARHSPNEQVDPIGAVAHVMGLDQGEETIRPSEAGIPDALIAGFQRRIKPLAPLSLGPDDTFEPLLASEGEGENQTEWTPAEKEVFQKLATQQACVKTIKNTEWTAFLQRFSVPHVHHLNQPRVHDDIAPNGEDYPYTSFVTSTSMLPPGGKKMRCFGSAGQYAVGVVFALPTVHENGETEAEACEKTETWSWPAGYAAKTEFNIDGRGQLINGRKEALRSLATLREYNNDYLNKEEYIVANRTISGLNQIPYNEVFLRVGGLGRIANGKDVVTGKERVDGINGRSLTTGVGLPIALFVRSAKYGQLIALLRARARLAHTFSEECTKGIPLLFIDPDKGVRVFTDKLQREVWKIASRNLNPFQNSDIAHKTTIQNTDEASFQQKVDELLHLDDTIKEMLTPEELGRIAGGFGATDESVASVLRKVLIHDNRINKDLQISEGEAENSHKLQDVVNEGLTAAVRAGDYYTSRQLLILYSLVASLGDDVLEDEKSVLSLSDASEGVGASEGSKAKKRSSSMGRDADLLIQNMQIVKMKDGSEKLETKIPPPPPPPPLDTDRLRSATNSDGLLAVLGAAQILKAMQDGSAKKRTEEAIASIEEWVNYGENSMAFRISSWYDQRAAQGDLKIAMAEDSNLMAFVSGKSISNRRNFARNLREAMSATSFTDGRFLSAILTMIEGMNKPCLRLELLQYVLGLDNRYSIAHVARSVQLAATCLGISAAPTRETRSIKNSTSM